MSTDRSIRLDVSVPRFGAGTPDTGASGQQAQPDAGDSDRFAQAMASPPPGPAPVAAGLPSPASLLGSLKPAAGAADPLTSELASRVGEALSRLMVGEGRAGGKQVRMNLKDDLLPGVTVSIEEIEGRLQVDFLCRDETSRRRLVRAAPLQAPELARQLRRDVLLRVQADDEEDPQLFEVSGAP
ncbi:hypothetical protein ACT80S_14965 [Ramlibacter sp. MAHUQ-53]|uniref:hypothetical protein n=1 Tax=unclassified Ramlibacter TaxID=2617605 RepID=UPI00363C0DD6